MKQNQTNKLTYKMYKKGRFWIFAGMAVVTINLNTLTSHADTTEQASSVTTTSESTKVSPISQSQVTLSSSTSTSSTDATTTTTASQASETVTTKAATTSSSKADTATKPAGSSSENVASGATKTSVATTSAANTNGIVNDSNKTIETNNQATSANTTTSAAATTPGTTADSATTTTAPDQETTDSVTTDEIGTATVDLTTEKTDQLSQAATVSNLKQLTTMALAAAAVQENRVSRASLVKADAVTIGSGVWGTSAWTVTSDGVLTIGSGTLGTGGAPWESTQLYASDNPSRILRSRITKVVIEPNVIAGDSISYMFFKNANDWGGNDPLTEIDGLENLDVSNTIDFSQLFSGDQVTDFSGIAKWQTSKATSFYNMFFNVSATELPIATTVDPVTGQTYWDVSNITEFTGMFGSSAQLKSLDLTSWKINTTQPVHMGGMFINDTGLTSLDLRGWDTRTVDNMSKLFSNTTTLTTGLQLGQWTTNPNVAGWTTAAVTNFSDMFNGAGMSEDMIQSIINHFDTSKATKMGYMFANLPIKTIDISMFDMSNLTDVAHMFQKTPNLQKITVNATTRLMTFDKILLERFVGVDLTNVPTPEGTWQSTDGGPTYTSTALMALYQGDANPAGTMTYIWSPAVRSQIATQDLTIVAGPNVGWGRKQSLSELVDGDGTDLLTNADISPWVTIYSVNGDTNVHKIDVHTPGLGDRDYTVVFSYTDSYGYTQQTSAVVHVLESKASLTVAPDQTIVAGSQTSWHPLTVVSAVTDVNGQPITDLTGLNISASSQPDLSQAGDYPIALTYTDSVGTMHHYSTTIHVVANQAAVTTTAVTVIAGPKAQFDLAAAINGLTTVDGQDTSVAEAIANGKLVADTSQLNLEAAGDQVVKVSYTDSLGVTHEADVTVHVVETKADLQVTDTDLIAGPKTPAWQAQDNFASVKDADGNPGTLADVKVVGQVESTTPNVYTVTYQYTDAAGNTFNKTATITVKASQADLKAKNSSLTAGENVDWSAADNLDSALDATGQPVDLKAIQVDGDVDTAIPGIYPVTYHYTDAAGNIFTATAQVTVVAAATTPDTDETDGDGDQIDPGQPIDPVDPTNPTDPVDPSTKPAVTVPESDQVTTDADQIQTSDPVTQPVKLMTTATVQAGASAKAQLTPVATVTPATTKLPQTDENDSATKPVLGSILLALTSLVGLIGLGRKRRHN